MDLESSANSKILIRKGFGMMLTGKLELLRLDAEKFAGAHRDWIGEKSSRSYKRLGAFGDYSKKAVEFLVHRKERK